MSGPSELAVTQPDVRHSTAPSVSTSVTHVQEKDYQIPDASMIMPAGGESEYAIPEDKNETLENLEDDWQHDLRNPRNWSYAKKWVRYTHLVSL
jgi:hypothetical protein